MPSPINLGNDVDYYRVELGPIPGLPDWHEQSKPSSYSFPSSEAASTFAQGHYQPGRSVIIHFPNGERWDGSKWL